MPAKRRLPVVYSLCVLAVVGAALFVAWCNCNPFSKAARFEALVRQALPQEDLTVLAWGPHDKDGTVPAALAGGHRPDGPLSPELATLCNAAAALHKRWGGGLSILRVHYRTDGDGVEHDFLFLVGDAGGGLAVQTFAPNPWGDGWLRQLRGY